MTVAVVNDHELVVRGVGAMLEPFRDRVRVLDFAGPGSSGRRVDVALCDTQSEPGGAGLEAVVGNPRVGRVVLYTWTLTEELVSSARARGVHAALPKSLGAERLAAALTLVHEGRLDVIPLEDRPGPARAAAGEAVPWPGRDAGLTARESEVVALVTSGLSNNEIAQRTHLSINSVKSYLRSAYRAMGVSSRSQAVLWGIDHGMAPTRVRILLPHPTLVTGTGAVGAGGPGQGRRAASA